jgi:hypothetical protein
VHAESSLGPANAVKIWNDLAVEVNYLAL